MSAIGTKNMPPYRAIYEKLRTRAHSVGSKGIRIGSYRDISKEFGVGQSTVVRAINMLKDEGWAYGRQGKGTYLVTKPLPKGISQIAFVASSLDRDTTIYAKGVDMSFDHKRYSLAVYSAHSNLEKFRYTVEHICEIKPAGVILSNPCCGCDVLKINFSSMTEAGIPVVVLGMAPDGLACDRIIHTRRDSAQKIADWVLKNNRKSIAVILTRDPVAKSDNACFLRPLKERLLPGGIEIGEDNIFYCDAPHGFADDPDPYIDSYKFAKDCCDRWRSFDTVIFDHDYIAVGFLRAVLEEGIKIPEQLKILSGLKCPVNGISPMNLTTIDSQVNEQARLAGELLIRRIEGYGGPREVHYIAGELIEGETT